MTEPLLNKQDLDSPAWKKIEEYLKLHLNINRRVNDNKLTMEDTAVIRGRIDMCKQIISLNPENEDI